MAPRRRGKGRDTSSASSMAADSTTDSFDLQKVHNQQLKAATDEMIEQLKQVKEAKFRAFQARLNALLISIPHFVQEMTLTEEMLKDEDSFYGAIANEWTKFEEKENREAENIHSGKSECGDSDVEEAEGQDDVFCTEITTVKKKRRSRSAGMSSVQRQAKFRKRSLTEAPPGFNTPLNHDLAKRLMSHKKYTVRKPLRQQESAVNVRRLMRAGEEAISITGSPLFVQGGSSCTEPQVLLPLPGGVVVNIEPNKAARQGLPKLPIDPQIRAQIRTLQENLGKLMSS